MKKTIIILAAILSATSLIAQSPEKISYQAVIRDAGDQLIINASIGMQISILQGADAGSATAIYVERQFPTTNSNGLATIEIGGSNATVISGTFSDIDWSNGHCFIRSEIDILGGSKYTISGTSQLLSVPYALYAEQAKNAEMVNITGDETAFEPWDKDESDDFDGQYNNLSGAPNLAAVSMSGSYNDLENKPELWDSTYSSIKNTPDLAGFVTQEHIDDLESEIRILEGILLDGGLYSVKDIDGNIYKAVLVGEQVWMAENLRTTKYSNGDLIGTTNPVDLNIQAETSPQYQWIYNNDQSLLSWGRLYTWYTTVDSRNVCPSGWHVPGDAEWTQLVDFLGGEDIAGGKLKSTGYGTYWSFPNTGATNESGFSAIPIGRRTDGGSFDAASTLGYWWSSTEANDTQAWHRVLSTNDDNVARESNYSKKYGFAIRCIRD